MSLAVPSTPQVTDKENGNLNPIGQPNPYMNMPWQPNPFMNMPMVGAQPSLMQMWGQQMPSMPMQNEPAMQTPPNLKNYDKKPDNSLTTGATVLCKLPEVRIQQIIEGIDSRLDTTLTGELDRRILAMIIQILCGMRPNRKVRPLQCATYEDLVRKMQLAAQRVRSKEGHDRMENATVLMVNSSCSKEMITKLATEFNWEEGNWIQTLSKKQKEALELEGDGGQQTTPHSCPFQGSTT